MFEIGDTIRRKDNSYNNVTKPKHYNVFEIEVLDIIRILLQGNENYKKDDAYKIGNVIKYIFRAGLKGDMLEDLQKAKFYLDSIIEDIDN